MRLWSECVPAIQSLAPERQHNLARVICNLTPFEKSSPQPVVPRLAADLRAIVIEISQRRSFQDRYANDLQATIEVGESHGGPGSLRTKASFVPPPLYSPSPTTTPPEKPQPMLRATPSQIPPSSATVSVADPRSPMTAGPTNPAIELIRETLYAGLADVLASTSRLHAQLTRHLPRVHYGAVALAILAIPARSVAADGDDGGSMACTRDAADCHGVPCVSVPINARLRCDRRRGRAYRGGGHGSGDRVRARAGGPHGPSPAGRTRTGGTGARGGVRGGRRSAEGRTVAFANRVNVLALSMTRLPQFRERQAEVFGVLAAAGGGH